MINNFYVYVYLDPRKPGKYKYGLYEFEYEPFYIGKGSNGRWNDINNGRSKQFKGIINNIKKSGFEPIVIKVKENLNEDNSFILESNLIKLIGRKDLKNGLLINFTNGGEGVSGWVPSEEHNKKISKTRKELFKIGKLNLKGKNNPFYGKGLLGENNPNYGKHWSEESKKKQSEKLKSIYKRENHPMFGKHHTEEWKKEKSENMRGRYKGEKNPMFGKKHSEETKRKQSEKQKGENSGMSILTEKNVIEIKVDLKKGILTQKEIGEKFGVKPNTISNIKNKRSWNHIK